jgi:flagellar basal-body rod protein FlgF
MIYGLYLSATGVLTNSHRQDVIANNLANSETVGFKRNAAMFQQRLAESQEARLGPNASDPMLDGIGGGLLLSPTQVDLSQGDLENTGNNLDAAIFGKGFFAVQGADGKTALTRDGQFMLNKDGQLILANSNGQRVLDPDGKPIELPGLLSGNLQIGSDGQITHQGRALARLGVFDVPEPSQLVKQGGALFSYPNLDKSMTAAADMQVRSGFVERANVDPANEMTQLMECQRTLEANANMIKFQDQALGRLVNDVGKIG